MPGPVPSWNTVPVYGTWLQLDGTPHKGQVKFTLNQRIGNTPSDAIFPKKGSLIFTLGAETGSINFDCPVLDDPDNFPDDDSVQILVEELFSTGQGASYLIRPLLAMADNDPPGLDLRTVVVPDNPLIGPASLLRGVPGGIAGLDTTGLVVNANGTHPAVAMPANDAPGLGLYFPESHGAVGNGTADDTSALQAALTAVPNGGSVYLGATYKTTAQLNLNSKTRVTIFGPGKILYTDTATSVNGAVSALRMNLCVGSRVREIEIDVVNQAQQYNGIQITNCTGCSVGGRTFVKNARWVGVAVDGEASQVGQSDRTSVEDCIVEYCRFGVASNGKRTSIHHNWIASYWLSSTEASVAWQSSSNYYDAVLVLSGSVENSVTNNMIIEPGQSGVYSTASNVMVTGNTILRPQNWGIDFGPGSTATAETITGNLVIDAAQGSINLFKVNNSTVTGNTCINTGATYFGSAINKAGIALNSTSSYNTISGNTVSLPAGTTAAAFFANTSAPKAIGNKFIGNNPGLSPVPYTMNFTDNTVIDTGQAVQFGATGATALSSTGLVTIDLSALSSFAGRNALKFIASSDNTYVQVTSDSPVQLLKSGGSRQDLTAGAVTGDSLSISGAAFFNGQRLTSVGTPTASTDAANKAYVDAIVNGAPGALDTLKELADALGDDANFATTITNLLAAKAPLTDYQVFTGNGTWTKPAGSPKTVRAICIGPGGGGAGGYRSASGAVAPGGGGGAAGAYSEGTFLASDLPSTVAISVSAGGAGGAGASADNSAGAAGGLGTGSTTFGSSSASDYFVTAGRGAGGSAPTSSAGGAGGGASGGHFAGSAGGTGSAGVSAGTAAGNSSGFASTGGGGGGGLTTGNAFLGGGAGGSQAGFGTGGTGGATDGAVGAVGVGRSTSSHTASGVSGGGGGAGSVAAAGGTGGAGGFPGGGGGGGGGSRNGNAAGSGGAGGGGICVVITTY